MEQYLSEWDVKIEEESQDKVKLYEELLDKLKEHQDNPEEALQIQWRLVQACLVLADSFEKVKNKAQAKKYTEESFEMAKEAIKSGPNSLQAHKWYCAAVGRMAPLVSTKERIKFGHEFKEHRDIAVGIDPNDELMHHMYGRWCYEVASLSFFERKIAESFFASPPTSTYEEALDSLQKAHDLKQDWKTNHLWLAKAYIALKKYSEAIKWIDSGIAFPIKSEDDAVSQIELKGLEKSYTKYRQ